MERLSLLVICGGMSCEHEVSIQSARSIIKNLDKSKYNITLVCIDKKGVWYWIDDTESIFNYPDYKTIPSNKLGNVASLQFSKPATICSENKKIDVAFPILHGYLGEDGSIQGLLKVAGIPFVGADVLSSAMCMDKHITKTIAKSHNIPIAKYTYLKKDSHIDFDSLNYPVFVKPNNAGSSVGISKVKSKNDLKKAVDLAFKYDSSVLIEECIEGQECEIALLGNEDVKASSVGEIIPRGHEFYSYEAKYLDKQGAELIIPADISSETENKIKQMAIKVYKLLNCRGMARVDFFAKKNGDVVFNEINTIPGFTSISMYPSLWLHSGIKYNQLLDKLIELART